MVGVLLVYFAGLYRISTGSVSGILYRALTKLFYQDTNRHDYQRKM